MDKSDDAGTHGDAPRTLTAALRVAVADARRLEAQHKGGHASIDVMPDSTRWYTPDVDEAGEVQRCEVCLAGALIAQRLTAAEMTSVVTPADWEEPWYDVLLAIDAMRLGKWHSAARHIDRARGEDIGAAQGCRERFRTLMRERVDEHTLDVQGQFRGWKAFSRFLDTMESIVIPSVEASERIAYSGNRSVQ